MREAKTHIQKIHIDIENSIQIDVLFDDFFGSPLQGNKWRKLMGTLNAFPASGKESIISFGGAFSNHIFALIYAGFLHKIPVEIIIRGEKPNKLSPTLLDCEKLGAVLHFVSRNEYTKYRELSYPELCNLFPNKFVVPEGGDFELGEVGFSDFKELSKNYSHIAVALGTGTTARGILKNMSRGELLIYPALKGKKNEFSFPANWRDHAHEGGYAKVNDQLLSFALDFYQKHKIPLDPIYTAKAMKSLLEDAKSGFLPKESKVLFYHTGGLQGIRGFENWAQGFENLGFRDMYFEHVFERISALNK